MYAHFLFKGNSKQINPNYLAFHPLIVPCMASEKKIIEIFGIHQKRCKSSSITCLHCWVLEQQCYCAASNVGKRQEHEFSEINSYVRMQVCT